MTAASVENAVQIPLDRHTVVHGDLTIPDRATGLVVFAHGSGSSRHSPRNQRVASGLHRLGLATLLIDLLTPEEERIDVRTGELRFDIELLAERLVGAIDWWSDQRRSAGLRVGYFGASTGAAAALMADARDPNRVWAVVARGGRVDLAGEHLANVDAPTLLIVGSRDHVVLGLNQQAHDQLRCQRRLEVVDGATHLFEEPGALEEVTRLAGAWFLQHLGSADPTTGETRPGS